MDNLKRNVRKLMLHHAVSQDDLGRAAGISQSTISRLLDEERSAEPNTTSKTIKKLADAFALTPEVLLGCEDDLDLISRSKHPVTKASAGYRNAPVQLPKTLIKAYDVEAIEDGEPVPDGWEQIEHIDFALSAGDGSEVPSFVETKYPMYYRMDWFHRCGAKPANVKSMSVRGDSMQFTLYDRDRVAVHTADRVVVSNAVYALLLDGEACIKRLFRHGLGLRIVSDNPDKARYPDVIITPEELHERVSIIGRVIDKSGAGGL